MSEHTFDDERVELHNFFYFVCSPDTLGFTAGRNSYAVHSRVDCNVNSDSAEGSLSFESKLLSVLQAQNGLNDVVFGQDACERGIGIAKDKHVRIYALIKTNFAHCDGFFNAGYCKEPASETDQLPDADIRNVTVCIRLDHAYMLTSGRSGKQKLVIMRQSFS